MDISSNKLLSKIINWKGCYLLWSLLRKIINWKWIYSFVCIIWLVTIIISVYWGFDELPLHTDFYQKWMLSALIWTLFFSIISTLIIITKIITISKSPEKECIPDNIGALLVVIVFGISIPSFILGEIYYNSEKFIQSEESHVIVGLAMSIVYYFTDSQFSKIDRKNKVKYDYTLHVADIPNVTGFAVLLLIFKTTPIMSPETVLGPFLSGAIAFQLITSGVAFAMLEQKKILHAN